jgi:hypothetical protein
MDKTNPKQLSLNVEELSTIINRIRKSLEFQAEKSNEISKELSKLDFEILLNDFREINSLGETIQQYESVINNSIKINNDQLRKSKIGAMGNWPFQMSKLISLLDENEIKVNKELKGIDTLIVGRNIYDENKLFEVLNSRELKRVITQEDFVNYVLLGVEFSEERTFENKIGHPIIEVIKAFSSKNKIIFNHQNSNKKDLNTGFNNWIIIDDSLNLENLKKCFPNYFLKEYMPIIDLRAPLFSEQQINYIKIYGAVLIDLAKGVISPKTEDQKKCVESLRKNELPEGEVARTCYRYIRRVEIVKNISLHKA